MRKFKWPFISLCLLVLVGASLVLLDSNNEKIEKEITLNQIPDKKSVKKSSLKVESKASKGRSIASYKRPDYNSRRKTQKVYFESFRNHSDVVKVDEKRSFQTKHDKLSIVENMVAIDASLFKEAFGEKIKFLNGKMIFVPSEEFKSSPLVDQTRPVVQFQSTGDIGVVTGKIALQFEKGVVADTEIFERNNLEVIKNISIINFYYVGPKEGDIYDVAAKLRLETGVKSVEVEVLKNPSVPD